MKVLLNKKLLSLILLFVFLFAFPSISLNAAKKSIKKKSGRGAKRRGKGKKKTKKGPKRKGKKAGKGKVAGKRSPQKISQAPTPSPKLIPPISVPAASAVLVETKKPEFVSPKVEKPSVAVTKPSPEELKQIEIGKKLDGFVSDINKIIEPAYDSIVGFLVYMDNVRMSIEKTERAAGSRVIAEFIEKNYYNNDFKTMKKAANALSQIGQEEKFGAFTRAEYQKYAENKMGLFNLIGSLYHPFSEFYTDPDPAIQFSLPEVYRRQEEIEYRLQEVPPLLNALQSGFKERLMATEIYKKLTERDIEKNPKTLFLEKLFQNKEFLKKWNELERPAVMPFRTITLPISPSVPPISPAPVVPVSQEQIGKMTIDEKITFFVGEINKIVAKVYPNIIRFMTYDQLRITIGAGGEEQKIAKIIEKQYIKDDIVQILAAVKDLLNTSDMIFKKEKKEEDYKEYFENIEPADNTALLESVETLEKKLGTEFEGAWKVGFYLEAVPRYVQNLRDSDFKRQLMNSEIYTKLFTKKDMMVQQTKLIDELLKLEEIKEQEDLKTYLENIKKQM